MSYSQIMSNRGLVRVLAMGLLVLALLCGSLSAQETWGSLRGVVTDPSGAAVPGAKVELSGGTLSSGLTVTSDSTGSFVFGQVPPGTGYSVNVTASGFRTSKAANIAVVLGRATTVDVKLEVGQISESVVVSADAVMVDTQSSSAQVTVDKSFFDLLPKGRSFYDLVSIAPGARNETKSAGFQVDGASGAENTFYLDGMEVTSIYGGTLAGQNRIPVEAVQQLQVKNGVMEAQYGGAMGGVVNAVVRSGSNDWHGQAGFYFNNNSMSARPRPTLQMDPTDTGSPRTKYRYLQNVMDDYTTWNPVISVGGPLVKNKLFFFAGYMPTRTSTDRPSPWSSVTGTFNSTVTQNYIPVKVDYVPASKLRLNMSWIYNPTLTRGYLPARDGTDDPTSPWRQRGDRTAGNILSGQVDYLPTSKMIVSFRGGYHYTNFNNMYAIPATTAIYYSNANTTLLPGLIPDNLRRSTAGWVVQAVSATLFDTYNRINLNGDVSYMASWHGQHSIKGGWQMNKLGNDVNSATYPFGYYRYYWDQSYACVTDQCSGRLRGNLGYYRFRQLGTYGDVSSNNMGLFLQDTWRVTKNLTLNLGLRTEREFIPSFAVASNIPSHAITFDWPSKLSPRVGFAWDPKGNGKMKIYGSWAFFYDIMKYALPRGSFGGDVWKDYFFSLDDATLVTKNQGVPTNPKGLPGKFFEVIDWRIPSNDPTDNTIDPNLKPMKQSMFDFGYDYSLSSTLVASVRYTNRRLIRTIEDVGTLGSAGEVYYIANPGYGITVDPKTWSAGFPLTPKAKRNYDAVEFRLDKRFTTKYQFAASYTWSRSYGNYSGLASSDEDGRDDPNVSRYFDLPWIGYNEKGQFSEGRLATDRPHTFKFFGGYTLKSMLGNTTLSPTIFLYSGTPLTTQANAISTVPIYPYGRGDLGRTPFYHNFDLNLMHDFKPLKSHEQIYVRFEFTVFNLFNNSTVTNKDQTLIHPDFGQIQFDKQTDIFKGFNTKALMTAQGIPVSPTYGLASAWQGPRNARLQLSFFF